MLNSLCVSRLQQPVAVDVSLYLRHIRVVGRLTELPVGLVACRVVGLRGSSPIVKRNRL